MTDSAKSPAYDKFASHDGSFIEDGFPFQEGFPVSGRACEILHRTGVWLPAKVDTSTQYTADGLRWSAGHGFGRVSEYVIAAWRELPTE